MIDGEEREYYVKLYPAERGKSRGLANEITGYLILHAMDIPQPESAYLVKIPLDALIDPPQAWIKNLQKEKGRTYWGFCCEKLHGRTAALHFGRLGNALLCQDIERWDKLPAALAADEHMAHTDRHFNNLICIEPGRYALIDNGKLITEEKNWALKDMVNNKLYRHRLSEHLWNHSPPHDISSGATLCAQDVAPKFTTIKLELEYWLTQLGMSKVDILAVFKFLIWRSEHLEELIKKRYRILL